MKVYVTSAKHFCGTRAFPVADLGGEYAPSLTDISADMPDAKLFEACLHAMAIRWSSSGGEPHFKSAMARHGAVRRMACGRVSVSGEGWSIMFSNEEIDSVEKEHFREKRWEEAARMMQTLAH